LDQRHANTLGLLLATVFQSEFREKRGKNKNKKSDIFMTIPVHVPNGL